MKASPTKLTKNWLNERGHIFGSVEQTIPSTFIKRDFLGCIDMIAIIDRMIVGIQITSASNHAARMNKAKAEPRIRKWIDAGAVFEVWSWKTKKERGKPAVNTLKIGRLI